MVRIIGENRNYKIDFVKLRKYTRGEEDGGRMQPGNYTFESALRCFESPLLFLYLMLNYPDYLDLLDECQRYWGNIVDDCILWWTDEMRIIEDDIEVLYNINRICKPGIKEFVCSYNQFYSNFECVLKAVHTFEHLTTLSLKFVCEEILFVQHFKFPNLTSVRLTSVARKCTHSLCLPAKYILRSSNKIDSMNLFGFKLDYDSFDKFIRRQKPEVESLILQNTDLSLLTSAQMSLLFCYIRPVELDIIIHYNEKRFENFQYAIQGLFNYPQFHKNLRTLTFPLFNDKVRLDFDCIVNLNLRRISIIVDTAYKSCVYRNVEHFLIVVKHGFNREENNNLRPVSYIKLSDYCRNDCIEIDLLLDYLSGNKKTRFHIDV